jgi:hypothetical protein
VSWHAAEAVRDHARSRVDHLSRLGAPAARARREFVLGHRIREKLSASYSPFASIDMQLEPDPYIESYIEVSGDPDRLDEIAAEVLADLADLRKNGPTTKELETAHEQLFREYELVNNPFLLERAIFFDEHDGRSLDELWQRYDIVYTITKTDIRSMARIAFPVGSFIEIKLIPEF